MNTSLTDSVNRHGSVQLIAPESFCSPRYISEDTNSGKRWYAVSVRRRAERMTALCLENKGYEYLLPSRRVKRRLSDRVKLIEQPLFSGYVFCKLDVKERLPLLTTPGVISLVGFGKEPIPVADSEIDAIFQIVRAEARAEEWPFVEQGQRVEITSGALRGLEGVVVRCSTTFRVVVSVTLLRRSVAVQVERSAIRLVQAPLR
ncbi:MAG: UpxY family transcription antiterminator [Bryobacteraceae bacterium]